MNAINTATTETLVMQPENSDKKTRPRLYYIDKLRTALTLLVIIHHCFWVVAVGWFPFTRPWPVDVPTIVLSFMFTSGNQAYFMGLFFFLSGLVTGPSLQRKGAWQFLVDRFYRLVIPAVIYDFILFPWMFCFVESTWYGPQRGSTQSVGQVWAYYYGIFGNLVFHSNHMWFTVTLFVVSLMAVCVLKLFSSLETWVNGQHSMQGSQRSMMRLLSILSAMLVIINFILRIPFPDGYKWVPLLANIGFIGQYIIIFAAGLVAPSFDFMSHLSIKHLPVSLTLAVVFYMAFQVFQTFMFDFFRATAGFYIQTFLITLFEQYFAVFWSYSLLVIFKEYQNEKPSAWMKTLIATAYATYIAHQWIIIPLAVGFAYTTIHPLGVIAILCLVSPFLCWGAGWALKSIPGSHRIL